MQEAHRELQVCAAQFRVTEPVVARIYVWLPCLYVSVGLVCVRGTCLGVRDEPCCRERAPVPQRFGRVCMCGCRVCVTN